MKDFATDFSDYCCSGHALLCVDTFEKDRAISEIVKATETMDRKVYIWSVALGWTDNNGVSVCEVPPNAQVEQHVKAILDFPERTVCVLRDFGIYVQHNTYPNYDVVIGWLDELRKIISSVSQTIVFVGPDFSIPKQLLHDITRIDFDLPSNEQVGERIEFACSDVVKSDGTKFKPDTEIIPHVVDACRGMTSQQIADRVSLALRKHKDLNPDAIRTIAREKAGVIRASGLLNYIEPPAGGLDIVGGYEVLKKHILLDKPCFTEGARQFGIEYPKGLLLVGVQGCGKTLLSTAIASELNLPLITMDIGSLMGSLVGESESNMREAIKMLESISPCVLVLDEIEKGFCGSGDMDGGTSRRVFGCFLKWLNDRTSPVYAIATANQVQSLPPELLRTGRFDAIFGLDLPSKEERQAIFHIHIDKRGRQASEFNLAILAEQTPNYAGSDIEQIVKLGLKMAFNNSEELSNDYLVQATKEVLPLYKIEPEKIETIRQWCAKHAKPANPPEKTQQSKIGARKINLN